jgi:plasmid stabilization system protein ParE
MKVIITNQSLDRLEELFSFYLEELELTLEKVAEIKTQLLTKARSLSKNAHKGQYEPYLKNLNKGHRRLIEGHFKIIYRIEGDYIYVTDFFDARQDPQKMKG